MIWSLCVSAYGCLLLLLLVVCLLIAVAFTLRLALAATYADSERRSFYGYLVSLRLSASFNAVQCFKHAGL